MPKQLSELQVDDLVTRNMMGILMDFKVTTIDDTLIHCGPWTFNKITGK